MRSFHSTVAMMWLTVAAMLPATAAASHVYGGGVILRIVLAVAAAGATEWCCQRLMKKVSSVGDGSAVLTGVIIGLSVPPLAPWHVPVFASVTGIALAKHCYGGLGNNPFNPAMAGYALAFVSFPADFSGWLGGDGLSVAWQSLFYDAVSAPTALAAERLHGASPPAAVLLPLAAAVGGGWLLWRRIADWRLTAAFIGGGLLANALAGGDAQVLLHGGFIFAAFFVVTDPVTAATTPSGRCLYGVLVGVLVAWLRQHGAHTDGIAFAVLAGNMLAPLCDYPAQRWRWR